LADLLALAQEATVARAAQAVLLDQEAVAAVLVTQETVAMVEPRYQQVLQLDLVAEVVADKEQTPEVAVVAEVLVYMVLLITEPSLQATTANLVAEEAAVDKMVQMQLCKFQAQVAHMAAALAVPEILH
jgi:hypothetical protein